MLTLERLVCGSVKLMDCHLVEYVLCDIVQYCIASVELCGPTCLKGGR